MDTRTTAELLTVIDYFVSENRWQVPDAWADDTEQALATITSRLEALEAEHGAHRYFLCVAEAYEDACHGYDTRWLHWLDAERERALVALSAAHDHASMEGETNG